MLRIVSRQVNLLLAVFTVSAVMSGQDIPHFKAEAKSALIWDERLPLSPTSSMVIDPLTGNEIHKLTYSDVEVSSRVGYEKLDPNTMPRLLTFFTTVANNSAFDVSVEYGSASVDGKITLPLSIVPSGKKIRKHVAPQLWQLNKLHCLNNGFAPADSIFVSPLSNEKFAVRPKTALTVSFVTLDPRDSARLCSVDGCYITGIVRYYVTVNLTDYVFVWPGRSIVYCGN